MKRTAPSHLFFRAAVCLGLSVTAGACDMPASSSQASTLTAAVESHPSGRRVDVLQGDALMMRMRISMAGVRIYDETGIRLGRVRLASNGWLLQNRVGETLCEISGETPALVLQCGDLPALQIQYDSPGELAVQRNGEPVAWLRFHEGQGTLTLPDPSSEWTATEGSMGIEIRTSGGELWRTEPPGLMLPAALSLAILPVLSEGSGADMLERAAVAWMVHRAVLGATHDGSGVAVEGSAHLNEGSGNVLEGSGSLREGSGAAAQGVGLSREGVGAADSAYGQSTFWFTTAAEASALPSDASAVPARVSVEVHSGSQGPGEASSTPAAGSGSPGEPLGIIPE